MVGRTGRPGLAAATHDRTVGRGPDARLWRPRVEGRASNAAIGPRRSQAAAATPAGQGTAQSSPAARGGAVDAPRPRLMIPIRDYNPTRRPSLLTWGLILINFAVYFYLAQNPVMDENAIAQYALVPADISAGRHLGTLITSLFLHANLLHVAGNMLFLWIFGNNVEDRVGEIKFVIIYFAAGDRGKPPPRFVSPKSTGAPPAATRAPSERVCTHALSTLRTHAL